MHLKISALLEVTVFAKEVFLNGLSLELFLVAFQYCFIHSLLMIYH